MPPEALSSMRPPPSIVIDQSKFTLAPAAVDSKTGQARRTTRGRPPGSLNKPKPPDGGVNPPSRMNIPAGKQPGPSEPVDNKEATKEAKKLRAEEYSTWIAKELNDKILTMIIGAGIPAEAIYKTGTIPPKLASNPNLTDFGNTIVIPGDVADSWGKLFAELSYTDAGKGVAKAADNHMLGIAFAALTALISTYRYSQQLKPVMDVIKQAQAARSTQPPEEDNGSTESNS